ELWDRGREEDAAGRLALARGQQEEAARHFTRAAEHLDGALATVGSAQDDLHRQISGRREEVRGHLEGLDRAQRAQAGPANPGPRRGESARTGGGASVSSQAGPLSRPDEGRARRLSPARRGGEVATANSTGSFSCGAGELSAGAVGRGGGSVRVGPGAAAGPF